MLGRGLEGSVQWEAWRIASGHSIFTHRASGSMAPCSAWKPRAGYAPHPPVPARPLPQALWALTALPTPCRRAAVLGAAPRLWLPHPHGQLHRQPGPAAEDALQQVRRRGAPRRGSRCRGRGHVGRGAARTSGGHPAAGSEWKQVSSWRAVAFLVCPGSYPEQKRGRLLCGAGKERGAWESCVFRDSLLGRLCILRTKDETRSPLPRGSSPQTP